jgi:2-iminoacetate synthase
MSKKNVSLKRKTLSLEEFKREFELLKGVGYKTIEIVGGGFSLKSGIGKMFLQFIDYGKKNVKNFAFFVDTLEPEEYKRIADINTTMIHWQESYFKNAYYKMVKNGPKTDFEKRLNAHDLYILAGGRKVGLSVLAGVADDFLKDVFMLLCHAKYLEKRYGISPSSFGTVRIKPIERKNIAEFKRITDEQMYLATAVYRLMFPESNIIATSRETQDVIAKQLDAGATFTNTTCTTVPGGYKEIMKNKDASIGQFHHESPSIGVVEKTIKSIGKSIDWNKEL